MNFSSLLILHTTGALQKTDKSDQYASAVSLLPVSADIPENCFVSVFTSNMFTLHQAKCSPESVFTPKWISLLLLWLLTLGNRLNRRAAASDPANETAEIAARLLGHWWRHECKSTRSRVHCTVQVLGEGDVRIRTRDTKHGCAIVNVAHLPAGTQTWQRQRRLHCMSAETSAWLKPCVFSVPLIKVQCN